MSANKGGINPGFMIFCARWGVVKAEGASQHSVPNTRSDMSLSGQWSNAREASNRDQIASFQREKQNYEDEIRRLKTELRRSKGVEPHSLGVSGSRLHVDTRVYLRTMARSRDQEKQIQELQAKYDHLRRLYEEKTGSVVHDGAIFSSEVGQVWIRVLYRSPTHELQENYTNTNTRTQVRDPLLTEERVRSVPRGVLPDLT